MATPPKRIREAATPPRPRDTARPTPPGSGFWEKIDNLFYASVAHAERAFRTNVNINIVIVGVGVSLIASSIAYSWLFELNVFSVAFASIGVADFVAIFFVNPQKGIHRTLGNLVQVQVAYRTYLSQLEALLDYDRQQYEKGDRALKDVVEMNEALSKVGATAIKSIQENVE